MKPLDVTRYDALLVGGSAGSFPVVSRVLQQLKPGYRLPIIMCLHRLKDKREGFKEALEIKSRLPVVEPNDKDQPEPGIVYLAPANYHLLIEPRHHFSLSTTELVQYSRPSIDVLFEAAADVYGPRALVLMLSGANRDGAAGVRRLKLKGATIIVQDPTTAAMATMPEAALQAATADYILPEAEIITLLQAFDPL